MSATVMSTKVVNTKVLRILTRLGAGGPPGHALTLTRELPKHGYPTLLVLGRCGSSDGDMSYLLEDSDPVAWIPEMSPAIAPLSDVRALWRLWRLMRRERPAIVHTHTTKAGLLGRVAAWLSGVPVIVHTYHGNVLSGYFPQPVNRLLRLLERLLGLISDALCVLSAEQAAELERFGVAPRAKIYVVPLGVDLAAFGRVPALSRSSRALVVGWVGRFVEIKNLALLAQAIEVTLARSTNVRFVVAGDGPGRALVEATVARFGAERVRWLGWQRDVSQVLAECDVVLLTSHNEGTPLALLQGMAARRPFVATAAGGVVDLVAGPLLHAGTGCRWYGNGVLVDSDPHAIAAALIEFEREAGLAAHMGARAREFACAHFAVPALLGNLERLYTQLHETGVGS